MLACQNPFAPDLVARLPYRFSEGSWESLLGRLEGLKWCGTIVGAPGTGKTTLLEQFAPRLVEKGFVPHLLKLGTESTMTEKEALVAQARSLKAPDFLLLDGAERLTTRQWLPLRVAIDKLAGCVVAVHRTSRLPTLIEVSTSPALLEELVNDLTGSKLPAGEAAAIHSRHAGNLRACFAELHGRFAG